MITVINEHITIKRIVSGCSIARFGDGEFKLCAGRNQISQPFSEKIQKKLLKVLNSEVNGLLIGVPRIYADRDFKQLPQRKKDYWDKYRKSKMWHRLVKEDRQYYSAFISRPDSAPCIDNDEYFDLVKTIWQDKNILIVEGKGLFGKNEKLIDNARSIERYKAPVYDAFADYDNLLKDIIEKAGSRLILLSLGPTATCLAYDLHINGLQAVDVGHMSMFYAKTHPKAKGYQGSQEDTSKIKMEQRGKC